MKNKIRVSIVLIALALITTNESRAAFPVKHAKVQTTASKELQNQQDANFSTSASIVKSDVVTTQTKVAKKHSFLSRLTQKTTGGGATISQGGYIVLAIIGFGWLAMGLNDNFGGSDWIISLVLYILFYFPGLIYTLIEMKKYY